MIKLGLRIRFFLYSNTLIVVTMTLVAVLGAMYQRRTLYDAIVGRGRSLVESMAVPITYVEGSEQVGAGETGLIERYLAEVMARNQDLMRYVVVTDGTGVISHASRPAMVGWSFDRALSESDIGTEPRATERFDINDVSVSNVDPKLVKVSKDKGRLKVSIHYERREHLMSNIDVIATFDKQVEVDGN